MSRNNSEDELHEMTRGFLESSSLDSSIDITQHLNAIDEHIVAIQTLIYENNDNTSRKLDELKRICLLIRRDIR